VLLTELAAWQRERILERELWPVLTEIELPLVHVLRSMERSGVRLNVQRLGAVAERVRTEIGTLEREIWEPRRDRVRHRLAPAARRGALQPAEPVEEAPRQDRLLDRRARAAGDPRRARGHPEDRALARAQPAHEDLPRRPAPARRRARAHPHDVRPGDRVDRAACPRRTRTCRTSRSAPPLGREIRGCFEAAEGHLLLSADYSQVELRILAHVAGEDVLKDIFSRGEDVHTATASQVFSKAPTSLTPMDRSKAKMINYGIVYGLSDYGLAERLNIPREEAKTFIDAYLERFGAVAAFMASTIESAKEHGHVVTLYGRRRQIPELRARNYQVRTLGERLAVNTVIQGTAADVLKLAMVRAHRALTEQDLKAELILTVHDELLFEVPEDEVDAVRALVEAEMLAPWGPREPPLAIDVGVGKTVAGGEVGRGPGRRRRPDRLRRRA
jgi:DNA polymerase-1